MFRPIALYIGLRYTRAKRRNHFISFISLVSMLGIALGVTVLITVLSVMNGFDYEIRTRLFNLANQVTITNMDGLIAEWQSLSQQVQKSPKVKAAAPFVNGQGMLSSLGHSSPVLVTGIIPQLQNQVADMSANMLSGNLQSLTPKSFKIVIGAELAENLGLQQGDKVVLFTPQATPTPMGIIPRFRQFTVSGIFHVDGNTGYDRGIAFINMQDAQALYNVGKNVSGLRLKVSDLYAAPKVSDELEQILPSQYIISNWTQDYGTFFKAIRMEKTMMFVILVLIIAVAAFNLVSTLVMVVTDKRAEIAILRTLGATPRTIMATFIVQGFVVGIIGTFLGIIFGVVLALNVTRLVDMLQQLLHVEFISSAVYFINYLPSRLEWSDVWHIGVIAIVLSLLATLYPAWQASRTQPAEALRYE